MLGIEPKASFIQVREVLSTSYFSSAERFCVDAVGRCAVVWSTDPRRVGRQRWCVQALCSFLRPGELA